MPFIELGLCANFKICTLNGIGTNKKNIFFQYLTKIKPFVPHAYCNFYFELRNLPVQFDGAILTHAKDEP